MKKMLGLDQNYQQLKQLQLLGPDLDNMSYYLISRYIQTIMFITKQDKFKKLLTILSQENLCSISSFKCLVFYNIAVHETVKQGKTELHQCIEAEISKLICLEQKRCKERHDKRTGKSGLSVEKAKNWLRETFSKSKQKPLKRQNKSFSNNTNILKSRQQSETTHQGGQSPMFRATTTSNQESEVQGKEQLLINKILIPYAKYILKLSASQLNFQSQKSTNLRTQQIWKHINLLNSLMAATQIFCTIMRYYRVYYEEVVQIMIRVIDNQIKLIYPQLKVSLMIKYNLIKKETLEVYEKAANTRGKEEKLEGIVEKFQVKEFKEIIDQIGKINQNIIAIYLGKYTYHKVKEMGLVQPGLLSDTNDCKFDLIFDMLKQVQKSKSQSKKRSNSKQRSMLFSHQNSVPVNISAQLQIKKQLSPGISSHVETLKEKKLKIVEGERKVANSMTQIYMKKEEQIGNDKNTMGEVARQKQSKLTIQTDPYTFYRKTKIDQTQKPTTVPIQLQQLQKQQKHSKQLQPLSKKVKVQGQKKITIPSSMTQIPIQKIVQLGSDTQSTFRKMRMNMTTRTNTILQDSNTRRLKL